MKIQKHVRGRLALSSMVAAALMVVGCQNISCPLDNVVLMTNCLCYQGAPVTMADTLSVTVARTDSVLLNRLSGFSSFQLKMHEVAEGHLTDTLVLNWSLKATELQPALQLRDSIFVDHDCHIYFESIDCPPVIFHNITSARSTRNLLDSVEVIQPRVEYEDVENLRLHLRGTFE